MNDQTDSQLLRAYAERHSEPAFAELVRRHIDLVYSAALRMVCDAHLAKDVTQGVFVALTKSAGQLAERPVLSGWLHRTAQNIAAQTVRTDVRRRRREQEAAVMNELLSTAPDTSWEEVAPHLDAALGELSEPERDAVLLRYFEKKSAQEMGQRLGVSDEAAQKRVSRAVERLRELLAKRGVTIGASGLGVVISANAVQAAPVGLAVTISVTAFAGTTAAAVVTKTIALTLLQKTLIGALLVTTVVVGVYGVRQNSRLRGEVQYLREQQAPLTQRLASLTSENDRLSNLVGQASTSGTNQSRLSEAAQTTKPPAGGFALSELELLLREAIKLPEGPRQKRLEEIARAISIADVPAATAIAEPILTSAQDLAFFQGTMMLAWAEKDPEGALNFAVSEASRINGEERQKFLGYVLVNWARKNPDAALAWIDKLPDGVEKQNHYESVLTALVETEPQKVFTRVKEMPAGRSRDRLLQNIATVLGNKDPKAAAEFGKSLPAGSSRDQFFQRLAAIWISKDPKAAVNFILEMPASGSRDELMRSAVSAWARIDPKAAATFAETMPFNRMWGMTGVAYNWAVTDHAAAWQWSLSIADDETRRSSLGGVLRCLATHSQLDEAAKYATQLSGDDQVRAVRSLLIDSSDLDPDWTSRWVATFPAGETRNQAVEKLVQHWSESDPMATAKWLSEQPQDAAFQSGARRLIPGMIKASPATAWDWAMILTDPAIKQERLELIAKSWLNSDAAAARAKIQSSSLSSDQIKKLLEQKP